jgi:hypothetical protein
MLTGGNLIIIPTFARSEGIRVKIVSFGGNSGSCRGYNMQEFRLPWNAREGIIYGCVIAALSSLIIGGYNVYDNMGYTLDTFGDFAARYIVIWPVMFLVAFTLANTVVGWGAKKIVHRYIGPEDSSNAYLCFNLIACVLLMSVILTFLGGLVGETIGYLLGGTPIDVMELIENWPRIWPRNFCIAFWVEMLIAQPAARMVMVRMHKAKMGEIPS